MACPCELTGQRHPIAWGRPGWRTSSPQSSADAARACPRGSLCRLPLPLRECLESSDDHREWVQPSLGGAVGADGFFGRLKTSEVLVLAVQLDLRLVCAGERVERAAPAWLVLVVLGVGRRPQVLNAVIRRIAVDVVDPIGRERAVMHQPDDAMDVVAA